MGSMKLINKERERKVNPNNLFVNRIKLFNLLLIKIKVLQFLWFSQISSYGQTLTSGFFFSFEKTNLEFNIGDGSHHHRLQ